MHDEVAKWLVRYAHAPAGGKYIVRSGAATPPNADRMPVTENLSINRSGCRFDTPTNIHINNNAQCQTQAWLRSHLHYEPEFGTSVLALDLALVLVLAWP